MKKILTTKFSSFFKSQRKKKLLKKSFVKTNQFLVIKDDVSTDIELVVNAVQYNPIAVKTETLDLPSFLFDFDIQDHVKDLSDKLDVIIRKLKFELFKIKEDVFKKDLTIYNKNGKYLLNLPILSTIYINGNKYLKLNNDEYGDVVFVNLTLGTIVGHYSNMIPHDCLIEDQNKQNILEYNSNFKYTIKRFFYWQKFSFNFITFYFKNLFHSVIKKPAALATGFYAFFKRCNG